MKTFRKILLAFIAAVAVIGPAMLPTQYQTPGVTAQAGKTRYYYVYYRTCPRDSWHYYGWYLRAGDAALAVRWFQYYGYEAFYR